jgi:hypothetical protein
MVYLIVINVLLKSVNFDIEFIHQWSILADPIMGYLFALSLSNQTEIRDLGYKLFYIKVK